MTVDWTHIAVGAVFGLTAAIILTGLTRRLERAFKFAQPSYEQLLRSRQTANFVALTSLFSLPWIVKDTAALHEVLGDLTAYLIFAAFYMLYHTVNIVYYLIDRRYPPIKAPEEQD